MARLALLMSLCLMTYAAAAQKVSVLIIDGQNNHDFEHTTPWLQTILERSGRFTVEVSRTPAGAPKAAKGKPAPKFDAEGAKKQWEAWRPDFAKHQVVMINYNGENWPEPVNAAFEKYVADGGGVVVVHAGNNPFPGWKAYDRMIGLGWRGADYGNRLRVDDAGKIVIEPPKTGPGAGHGKQHAYTVITRDATHPVMQGLPALWMHPTDELYHGQRGPAENMTILATAFSDPKGPGGEKSTGAHEPLVWWIPYEKGKVFTCLLGHVGRAEPINLDAMRDACFVAIVTRAAEWVATGQVTIPLPAKLPTASETSLVNP